MQNLILIMLIIFTFIITGCNDYQPKISESESRTPIQKVEASEPQKMENKGPVLLEVSTNPEILTTFWDEYLLDASMTIANGQSQWESFDEIRDRMYCQFLYLKMQENKDTADIVLDGELRIKREKFEEYSNRYFNAIPDFNHRIGFNASYHIEDDTVRFNADGISVITTKYNDHSSYPRSSLESISFYDDNSIIASLLNPTEIKGEEYYVQKYIKMKQHEDGAYYFVSLLREEPETDFLRIDGEYKTLPKWEFNDLGSFQGFINNTQGVFISMSYKGTIFTLVDFSTSEILKTDVASLPNHLPNTGYPKGNITSTEDYFIVRYDDIVQYINRDFTGEIQTYSLPIEHLFEVEGFEIQSTSADISQLTYITSDEKGFYLYDIASDKSTLIPTTARYKSNNGIAEWIGVRYPEFTDDDKKIISKHIEWEWLAGYSVYDIETGKNVFFDASELGDQESSYYISVDNGIVFEAWDEETNEISYFRFDFDTMELHPFQSYKEFLFPKSNSFQNACRPFMATVNNPYSWEGGDTLISNEIKLVSLDDLSVDNTGVSVVFPGYLSPRLYTAPNGDIYAHATYYGEEEYFLIENR